MLTIVMVMGNGHFKEVKSVLFRVVTRITIVNHIGIQMIMAVVVNENKEKDSE